MKLSSYPEIETCVSNYWAELGQGIGTVGMTQLQLFSHLIFIAVPKKLVDVVKEIWKHVIFLHEDELSMQVETAHIWTDVITSPGNDYLAETTELMDKHLNRIHLLANAKDRIGRRAIDIASPDYRQGLLERMYFCKRYEFREGPPEHISETCVVLIAKDQNENGNLVALKFMRNKTQFLQEIAVRQLGKFDLKYVIGLETSHDGDIDQAFKEESLMKGFHPYCIVMPAAERNLAAVIAHEHIAGRDWDSIRLISRQLCDALNHMHNLGYVHGDVKPLNIMRRESRYMLIDLDACVSAAEKQYVGCKYSSGYLPPEMIALLSDGSTAVKTYKIDPVSAKPILTDLPYELVVANGSHDMWSLGVTLYQLFTGKPLLLSDDEGNIGSTQRLALYYWTDETKKELLSEIGDAVACNLISRLLHKDPRHRPTAEQVLAHPFLSGKKSARLVGDEAEYDVFLSYRVNSDYYHAEYMYDLLTARGLKVWWDKKCLAPGVPWEEGFCDGLVNSRAFVPLLSREAINSGNYEKQNFGHMTEDSPVDNVYLEYRLALELHHFRLLEFIFPVLIGDCDERSFDKILPNRLYSSYFRSGCHPTSLPDVVVSSVEAKVQSHLDRQGLGSIVSEVVTVKGVVDAITTFQGGFIQGIAAGAFSQVVNSICLLRGTHEEIRAPNGTNKIIATRNTEESRVDIRRGSGVEVAIAAKDLQITRLQDENNNLLTCLYELQAVLSDTVASTNMKDNLNKGRCKFFAVVAFFGIFCW